MIKTCDLRINDRFILDGKKWTVRGWYSAVGHVAAESDDGEKRVVSIHGEVVELIEN